jgi:hypothetical protein
LARSFVRERRIEAADVLDLGQGERVGIADGLGRARDGGGDDKGGGLCYELQAV